MLCICYGCSAELTTLQQCTSYHLPGTSIGLNSLNACILALAVAEARLVYSQLSQACPGSP